MLKTYKYRIFPSDICNNSVDRDLNAAYNIKKIGLGNKPADAKVVQ